VEALVVLLQALEDLQRFLRRGLTDLDLLEAPREGVIALEELAELFPGGRADAADLATRQQRLEDRRGVERPAAGRAGADELVDLVDEEDRVRQLLELPITALRRFSKSPR
jgi:hypothetical protein